jgi:hypothetical protein
VLSDPEKKAALQRMTPDEQIDLQVAAMLATHPPFLGVGVLIAEGSSEMVDPLEQRLRTAHEGDAAIDAMCLLAIDLLAAHKVSGTDPAAIRLRDTLKVRTASIRFPIFDSACARASKGIDEIVASTIPGVALPPGRSNTSSPQGPSPGRGIQ